jgi:hypothetical protein
MLARLRRWREARRSRGSSSLAADEEARRQAERHLREQERRMAEERLRIESRSPGPW